MTHSLELVKAGAGAGKTYDLCEYVYQCIEEGDDPAKILATTFTRKAAAELKGRVQEKLRSLTGKPNAPFWYSDRFELAFVGTVHSIAHQLLSQFAIEMGISPELEVIMEDEAKRVLAMIVGEIIATNGEALGDPALRMGVAKPEQLILEIYNEARGNRISDETLRDQMLGNADRLCEIMHSGELLDSATFHEEFESLVSEATQQIGDLDDATKTTATALNKLDSLLSAKYCDWGRAAAANSLKAGKRSGADNLLTPLRDHIAPLLQLSDLHDDIRSFSSTLCELIIQVGNEYQQYKTARGLVDYHDLEVLFLELLEREDLASQLAQEFSIVLVDEFQDTNPLQLLIFNKLRDIATKSRWVGDAKQAIYGFRNTDPELIERIWNSNEKCHAPPLPNNWRSQKGLVQFVGQVFSPIFGEDTIQTPQNEPHPEGLERWILDTKNITDDAAAILAGVETLHQLGHAYGDMAILARSNYFLQTLTTQFDEASIPYLLESPGLLQSREIALTIEGLRLVLDRYDSLAAASIKHFHEDPTEETPAWIYERLEHLETLRTSEDEIEFEQRKPWPNDPIFARIEAIDNRSLSPTAIIQQVIQILDVYGFIATWDDPVGRFANLDSLIRHAQEYEDAQQNASRAATLSGFLHHMSVLSQDDQDICYPPLGHNAVTLSTYHGAKGLEWPVVILTELDKSFSPQMFKPQVIGGGADVQNPLDGRQLRAWTWPFGMTRRNQGRMDFVSGSGLENTVLTTPEGSEQQLAQDAESVRLLYVGATRAKDKLVFAHRVGKTKWLDQIEAIQDVIPYDLPVGEHNLDGIDTTIVVRQFEDANIYQLAPEPEDQHHWLHAPRTELTEANNRFYSPSAPDGRIVPENHEASLDEQTSQAFLFTISKMEGGSKTIVQVDEAQYADFGNAVHHFFGALPNLGNMATEDRLAIASQCLSGYGLSGAMPPATLLDLGSNLQEWVSKQFPEAKWHTELPAVSNRSEGGEWRGIMDLVLELPNGSVVLIDHKSGQVDESEALSYAQNYAPQLDAYREMLEQNELVIDSMWIHLPMIGLMLKYES